MKTAVDVFKVILKFGVSNITENELGKELAAVFTENGIDKIENSIIQGRSQIECVLSRENLKSMNISEEYIDFIIAEIKELLSKIEITGEIFRQCKYDSSNLEDFLWKEYSENKNSYIEYENEIKRALFAITEVLIKLMRESDGFENEALIHISNTVDDIKVDMREGFNSLKETQKCNTKNKEDNVDVQDKKFQKNKKKDYFKTWNSRLFLHIDNEENPITLADAFIIPDYKIYNSIKKIGFTLDDTLDVVINKFIKYNNTSTMLIAGVPGIGKSSIVSWIANECKDCSDVIILRFRDWKREELENGILNAVCNSFCCNNEDLEDRILILDGFDEMKLLSKRKYLLNEFMGEMKDFDNFKCIITSRLGYIDTSYFNVFLEVKKFNIYKVEDFCKIITGYYLEVSEKIKSNLDVLGIPVILYMALMSDIDISENLSKPELYNRIFAQKGGIFDKFCYEGRGYDKGLQILRDPNNVKIYLEFLQGVSSKMFRENSLLVTIKEEDIPELEIQKSSVKILEFPIKNLFEKNDTEIEFIHKSIFEYFFSEYIFNLLVQTVGTKYLAEKLAKLLKEYALSDEVLEFLKYKVKQIKGSGLLHFICETFQLMLHDGMTFYTKECYRNVVECEIKVFRNMLEILHLWECCDFQFDKSICKYIKYSKGIDLNLSGLNLSGLSIDDLDLTQTNLSNANLSNVNLRHAKLIGADLTEADLSEAKLFGAQFIESKVVGANFMRAKLNESDLSETDLTGVIFYK